MQKRSLRFARKQISLKDSENKTNKIYFKDVIEDLKIKHQKEIKTLTETYENQIYIERFRGDSVQREAFDRFLQLLKLNPTFFTSLEAPLSPISLAKEEIKMEEQEKLEEEITLSDIRDQFWKDGQEQGKSDLEIQTFWEMKKPEILEDVKLVKYPMTSDQEQ